jgi:hypothetical protein
MTLNISVGPNVQVTYDGNPANDRSESSLAADPTNPARMVGSSKKFTDPADYAFTLAAYLTSDTGSTWSEAAPLTLIPGWGGISDPAVAIDSQGNAYLVALPFKPGNGSNDVGDPIGIAIYRSPDGLNWSPPNLIHTSADDDKQSAAADGNPASPHYGNVYAAWDDGHSLAFARTLDSGQNWIGVGAQPVGTTLATNSFSPAIAVAPDGAVYIAWLGNPDWTNLYFAKSTDGGDSFSPPATLATQITPLGPPGLPAPDGFPELPGGSFRVDTFPTICAGLASVVTVAWADYRDGVSRIYYRRSLDGSATWDGPGSGQLMIASGTKLHDFHPQLAVNQVGTILCSFYEFGPMPTQNLINVMAAVSGDLASSFGYRVTVTDQPWDPAVNAPRSHGKATTTFIGDYFGLAASPDGYFPFWTDTRTGIQEIFCTRVQIPPAVSIKVGTDECGLANGSFRAITTNIPTGIPVQYAWSATGGTIQGAPNQPYVTVVPDGSGQPVVVTVKAIAAGYTVSSSAQWVTLGPLLAEWLEELCKITHDVRFNPFVDPLWDPLRDLILRPIEQRDRAAIRATAQALVSIGDAVRNIGQVMDAEHTP